jgi:hypothetical protein
VKNRHQQNSNSDSRDPKPDKRKKNNEKKNNAGGSRVVREVKKVPGGYYDEMDFYILPNNEGKYHQTR